MHSCFPSSHLYQWDHSVGGCTSVSSENHPFRRSTLKGRGIVVFIFLAFKGACVEDETARTMVCVVRVFFSFPLLAFLALRTHCSRLVTPGPTSTKFKKSVPYSRVGSYELLINNNYGSGKVRIILPSKTGELTRHNTCIRGRVTQNPLTYIDRLRLTAKLS